MKLEELQKFWEKDVNLILSSGEIISGFFCSFERAEDEPNGRDCITVEDKNGCSTCVYLDEINEISIQN